MDHTFDINVKDERAIYLSTPSYETTRKKIMSSIPLVYTTRLEDMCILNGDTSDMKYSDIMNKVLQESKPEFNRFSQSQIFFSHPIRKNNPSLYMELCRKLNKIRQKYFNVSEDLSIMEHKNDIVTLKTIIEDTNKISSEIYYMSLCKPCSVVLEDFRKCSYNYKNKESLILSTIIIPSDDEYDDDILENTPLHLLQKQSTGVQDRNSSPSFFKNCGFEDQYLDLTQESTSSSTQTAPSDYDYNDDILENTPLHCGQEQSTSVKDSSSSRSIFKNCMFIFEDQFLNLIHIYYVNEHANLKGYFKLPKLSCYRHLIHNYGNSSTRAVIKKNCCWYKRENEILLHLFNCIKKSVSQFMRIQHTCAAGNCICCCKHKGRLLINSKLTQFSCKTSVISQSNTRLSYDRAVENFDKNISQTVLELSARNKNFNKYALPTTSSKFCAMQSPQLPHIKFIKKILDHKNIAETLIKKKTFSLDVKNNAKSRTKSNVSIPLLGIELSQKTVDFHIIDSNRKLLMMYRLVKSPFIIRRYYDLVSLEKQYLCCWYKRESFISKLNLLPNVKGFLRIPHLCEYDKCTCCCKPKLHKKMKLYNLVLSTHVKHMTLNKLTERKVKLRNFDIKTKVIKFINTKDLIKKQNVTNTQHLVSHTQHRVPYMTNQQSSIQNFALNTLSLISNTQNRVPKTQNLVSKAQNVLPSVQNFVSNIHSPVPNTRNLVPKVQNLLPSIQNYAPNLRYPVPITQNIESNTQRLTPNTHNFVSPQQISPISQYPIPATQVNVSINKVPTAQKIQNTQNTKETSVKSFQSVAPNDNESAAHILQNDINNENILQSILTEAMKYVGDVQSEGLGSFISSILERFRDVRLAVNEDGRVDAVLNVPISTLSNTELKVLANILYHAQSQVDALRIFKKLHTETSTNITSDQMYNTTPINTKFHKVLSNTMISKNAEYLSSYQSYIARHQFEAPVIQNVFSLKNTQCERNMDVLPKEVEITGNHKQSSTLVITGNNDLVSVNDFPSDNIKVPSTTQLLPAANRTQQPILIVDSGSIGLPTTSVSASNVSLPGLALSDNEIKSMMLPDTNESYKKFQSESSEVCKKDLSKRYSLLYSLLNKESATPNKLMNLIDTPHSGNISTDPLADPLEPAPKRKKIDQHNDTFEMPAITSVSSVQIAESLMNGPMVENKEIDNNFDDNVNSLQIIENNHNDIPSLKYEILISDDEELPDVVPESDSKLFVTKDEEIAHKDADIDKTSLSKDNISNLLPLQIQHLMYDNESILGM